VVRNVGNLVPPAKAESNLTQIDGSALAAAEFSVLRLNVSHIVVCGHSECGAMNALASAAPMEDVPHFKSWLTYGMAALQKLNQGVATDPTLSRVNQLSQLNVLQQIEHLKSHSFIRRQVEKSKLQIHGWWFDIAKADVYSFEETRGRFQLIE